MCSGTVRNQQETCTDPSPGSVARTFTRSPSNVLLPSSTPMPSGNSVSTHTSPSPSPLAAAMPIMATPKPISL
ncbi:hypothetical protein PIB30_039970 [Stylosanthes scabra]|uniref:Uncharacterized protein n=1 Tax=Stylosanthes scabra TaxID=79078 RepID=A0ABU6VCC9_9FABA|nr:hypothetical protein [Stylosanthes scabra]